MGILCRDICQQGFTAYWENSLTFGLSPRVGAHGYFLFGTQIYKYTTYQIVELQLKRTLISCAQISTVNIQAKQCHARALGKMASFTTRTFANCAQQMSLQI